RCQAGIPRSGVASGPVQLQAFQDPKSKQKLETAAGRRNTEHFESLVRNGDGLFLQRQLAGGQIRVGQETTVFLHGVGYRTSDITAVELLGPVFREPAEGSRQLFLLKERTDRGRQPPLQKEVAGGRRGS